jgi:A/G-specific adenine glycosylase
MLKVIISLRKIHLFQRTIWQYYKREGRDLPWRKTTDPYQILVSEIMLQQTQVERVIEKYDQFLSAFPDFPSLAQAPLKKVLSAWQGLGYNRRALALKYIAQDVMKMFHGIFPSSEDMLVKFPCIGKATAGAVAAFAFHKPSVFIETNIRRVFIHFFFRDKENVRDTDIFPLIEKTLDTSDPRQWYYALMDYGSMLAKQKQNPNRKSAHYQQQSPFKGSHRQLRGMVLRAIIAQPSVTESMLLKKLDKAPERVREALLQLQKEGFIQKKGRQFTIS